jgi:5-methylcytosine-specific restriction enzyme subunit McrC
VKILPARERAPVDIPMSDILSGGDLIIRPELIDRGLVELRQNKFKLQLKINGVVGRLPITSDLALDIEPKFPISNLNRVVYASGAALENPFFIDRPYHRTSTSHYLPVPLVRTFSTSLDHAISSGLHREYLREVLVSGPRPKINFRQSDQRFWSKLIPTKAVVELHNHSPDNIANQCLKLAALKALGIARTTPQLSTCISALGRSLRALERVSVRDLFQLKAELAFVRGTVPSFRADYADALGHGLEILRHTDVSLNVASSGLRLESFLVSLDDAFERYLRVVLGRFEHPADGTIRCVDGNQKRHQRPLFADNSVYKTKPDLIFRGTKGTGLIGDAKYKPKASEEDRYQIISHALSHKTARAILIYPRSNSTSKQGLFRLGMTGDGLSKVEVYEYYFDLAGDLDVEEQALRGVVAALLGAAI